MNSWLPIVLFAAAGFLLGGMYAAWKTAKFFAAVLALLAVLAVAAGVAWLAS